MDKVNILCIYTHTIIYIHDGILFSHKKNEILSFATRMDLEGIMLGKITQTEKNKYHMISLIRRIQKKKKKVHRNTENGLVAARGRERHEKDERRQKVPTSSHTINEPWRCN